MEGEKTVEGVLLEAEETLRTASLGLEVLRSREPRTRVLGVRNVVVFGRAVTNVLQNLRRIVADFDSWYGPHQKEMRGDPLLRFFYHLRSQILKEGPPSVHKRSAIDVPDTAALMARYPKPANAVRFFVRDRYGGAGWEVEMPGGGIEKLYVDFPHDVGEIEFFFEGAPKEHLGSALATDDVVSLCELYVSYLERLVAAAREKFGSGATAASFH